MTTVTRMHRPNTHFTQISNEFLRAEIPTAAFRVACFILSHEAGYLLTQERVARAVGLSRNTVASALQDLERLGYLITQPERDERGHKLGSHLLLSDVGFSDAERASLSAKTAHRVEDSEGEECTKFEQTMPKNCADLCSKIEQHKNTKKNTKLEDKRNLPASPGTGQALAEIDRPDVEDLCSLLRDRIIGNGCRPPNITQAWRDAARLLLDRDGISFNEARAGILWCTQDQFWSSNILSMPTYRKQFDKLRLEARRQQIAKQPQRSTVDEKVQGWVDMPANPEYVPPWRRSAE